MRQRQSQTEPFNILHYITLHYAIHCRKSEMALSTNTTLLGPHCTISLYLICFFRCVLSFPSQFGFYPLFFFYYAAPVSCLSYFLLKSFTNKRTNKHRKWSTFHKRTDSADLFHSCFHFAHFGVVVWVNLKC